MITLDATATARADSTVRGLPVLIELDFLSGTQRLTNWPVTISSGGFTYLGLGDVIGVPPIGESEDTKADKITLQLSLVNTAMLAALSGSPTEYRGRAVRLYGQFIDDVYQPAGAFALFWAGEMNKVSVPRKKGGIENAPTGTIDLECVRSGASRMKNDEGLRLTHAQQQQRYPGDNGLEYIDTLVQTPALWQSKRFQQV